MSKTLKKLADESRNRDGFWVEKAKIKFAEDLFELMSRRGTNKSALADKFGSSPAYMTKVFRGDVNFTIETMVKLARALNGKVDIHVTAAEDNAHWFNVIKNTSYKQCAAMPLGRFETVSVFERDSNEMIANGTLRISAG